jgi:iron complex outermembrane receptor protein
MNLIKVRVSVLIFVFLLTVPAFSKTRAKTPDELLFMDIPDVFTASKRSQPAIDAPASVTVITAQDIKDSGASNIPDMLRSICGINVNAGSNRDYNVSMHGFQESSNSGIMVLIDGRAMDWDLYGTIMWDIPILDEIERIEIVKGPGSSLYGANAYTGVINIITKTPGEIDGTELSLFGGDPRIAGGTLIHGIEGKKISYKASVSWDGKDEWTDTVTKDAGAASKANALLEYKFNEDQKLAFSAGTLYSINRKILGWGWANLIDHKGYDTYGQVKYDNGPFTICSYYKTQQFDVSDTFPSLIRGISRMPAYVTLLDIELQHTSSPNDKNTLVWGADYKNKVVKQTYFIGEDHYQDLYAAFAEDEYRLSDKLSLTLGGRYDYHPLVKGTFSPRGNITYKIKKDNIIRVSAAHAFRNPPLLASYFYTNQAATFPGLGTPILLAGIGNTNLNPEEVNSYQAEYRDMSCKSVKTTLNIFFDNYKNFIRRYNITTYYPPNYFYPGSPAGIPMSTAYAYANGGSAQSMGAELDTDFLLTKWATLNANYAYHEAKELEDNPYTVLNETDRIREEFPKNSINLGLKMKFNNGLYANAFAHWIDRTVWYVENFFATPYLLPVDAYTLYDANIGYNFNDNMEIQLSAFDVFNTSLREMPVAPANSLVYNETNAEPIGRRLVVKATYKF